MEHPIRSKYVAYIHSESWISVHQIGEAMSSGLGRESHLAALIGMGSGAIVSAWVAVFLQPIFGWAVPIDVYIFCTLACAMAGIFVFNDLATRTDKAINKALNKVLFGNILGSWKASIGGRCEIHRDRLLIRPTAISANTLSRIVGPDFKLEHEIYLDSIKELKMEWRFPCNRIRIDYGGEHIELQCHWEAASFMAEIVQAMERSKRGKG